MNWFEGFLYGFVSGIAEFLPISSQAHQKLLLTILGTDNTEPVRNFLVHLAILVSLLFCCRSAIERIRRERAVMARKSGRHNNKYTTKSIIEFRFLKTATIPLVIGLILLTVLGSFSANLVIVSIALVFNGIILFIPERMMQGNKDARTMTRLDGLLMGFGGVLSIIPGISRMGCVMSIAKARGADREKTFHWALLLSIPVLIVFLLFDVWLMITQPEDAVVSVNILGYILSTIGGLLGSYVSIMFMRFLAVESKFSGFAYYCWCAALFSFALYLIVV